MSQQSSPPPPPTKLGEGAATNAPGNRSAETRAPEANSGKWSPAGHVAQSSAASSANSSRRGSSTGAPIRPAHIPAPYQLVTSVPPPRVEIPSVPQAAHPDWVKPGTLEIELQALHLNSNVSCASPFLRVSLADQSHSTLVYDDPDEESAGVRTWHFNDRFHFRVSYHAQLFSSLQVDLVDARVFIPDVFVGRSELRISALHGSDDKPITSPHLAAAALAAVSRGLPAVYGGAEGSTTSGCAAGNLAIPLNLPLYHHRHTPSRWPVAWTGAARPTLGRVVAVVRYAWQDLASQEIDYTAERMLAPRGGSATLASAMAESALRALALSRATRETLKSVFQLVALFGQGVDRVSIAEWMCGILLLQRYYETIDEPKPIMPVTDRAFFSETLHYKKYATAAYGWRGLMFFGKSKSLSDKLSLKAHLPHVGDEDWLTIELDRGDVFQPCFFVVHDRKEDALVISIRGTMSSVDAITDLVCEYVRMDDGLVHRGMKIAADWLVATLYPKIAGWVEERRPSKIVVVGHSLGAGIASLVAMILSQHFLPFLRELRPGLQLGCYAFGPPPVCSLNLARRHRTLVRAFVYGNDCVSRLSYGAVLDFRTCLLTAVGLVENHVGELFQLLSRRQPPQTPLASQGSTKAKGKGTDDAAATLEEKFQAVSKTRIWLTDMDINPKLYIPGTIYRLRYVPKDQLPASAAPMSPISSEGGSTGAGGSAQDLAVYEQKEPPLSADMQPSTAPGDPSPMPKLDPNPLKHVDRNIEAGLQRAESWAPSIDETTPSSSDPALSPEFKALQVSEGSIPSVIVSHDQIAGTSTVQSAGTAGYKASSQPGSSRGSPIPGERRFSTPGPGSPKRATAEGVTASASSRRVSELPGTKKQQAGSSTTTSSSSDGFWSFMGWQRIARRMSGANATSSNSSVSGTTSGKASGHVRSASASSGEDSWAAGGTGDAHPAVAEPVENDGPNQPLIASASTATSAPASPPAMVPILERADPVDFGEIAIRTGMFADHLPIAIEDALQAWLETQKDPLDVDT